MDPSPLQIAELPQAILLAAAFAIGLISASFYRRARPSVPAEPARPAPVAKVAYSDAPTVRVLDSQHFDRLHKPVHLAAGQHIDIVPTHPVVGPRFRITLHEIATHEGHDAAHVSIVYAGVQLSCGPRTKELDYNEFLMPVGSRDESRSSIFHFQETTHTLEFLRIKVNAIDPTAKTAELEVTQMRGKWPGGDA
jgi:hypothetical protein